MDVVNIKNPRNNQDQNEIWNSHMRQLWLEPKSLRPGCHNAMRPPEDTTVSTINRVIVS